MPRIRKSQNQPTISRTVWRIAVYIRLSKDDGNDESLSVTNQRKIITEYINVIKLRISHAQKSAHHLLHFQKVVGAFSWPLCC